MTRWTEHIPVRVAVTGTRGKSTVTRMIAAALREAGYAVLAKTTGSKAVLILPDGREEEVPRRGLPTILEQKKLAKRASDLHVRAVVSELMSIRPECLAVESRLLLRPHFLVVTNVRLDHQEEMGNTRPEIARSLSSAIGRGAKVFLPVGAQHPEFENAARRAGADIIHLPDSEAGSFLDEDRRLAAAVAAHLGVAPAAALRGIQAAAPDFGSLKAWEAELGAVSRSWVLVSAFAANEPESTGLILDYLQKKLSPDERSLVGVLNFRADRGDRTRQWLEAHRRGFFAGFRNVYVVGAHVHSLRLRKKSGPTPNLIPLPEKSAAAIMGRISSAERAGCVLVGCGNIGGLGGELVQFWQSIGRPLAI